MASPHPEGQGLCCKRLRAIRHCRVWRKHLFKRAGLDLVPTRVGGESSPAGPFTTALSQYGSTEPFRPVQKEVSTSTQAGLRQGFRWLGEIVHRVGSIKLSIKIDPLLVPSPLPSRTSPPGHAQSIGSVVGPATPNQRSLMPPSSWEERPPEGTAPLFSQEQMHQLRRPQQASPLLQGPLQAQEEQTSSSNTTNIQEEVRRQVSHICLQVWLLPSLQVKGWVHQLSGLTCRVGDRDAPAPRCLDQEGASHQ